MLLRLVELFGRLQDRNVNTEAQRRNRHALICNDSPFQCTLSHRPTMAPARKFIGSSYLSSLMDDNLIEPLQSNIASHSKDNVARFQAASLWKARWQVINSFVPYALLWFAMDRALAVSYWLMLPIAILAAGFLVRIFIIFHDCGHGSFFKSKRANDATGAIAGLLLLTPYRHWRWQHALHHGTAGDLDRRGSGDIWTLTVKEYLQSTRLRRFAYRLARNPIVLLVLGPLYLFAVHHRFAVSTASIRERQSVHRTNWVLLGVTLLICAIIGLKAFLLIQLTVLAFAGALGVWLFYVQHQFDGAYWARTEDWNYTAAALQGSSFYKLPRILQWFTGNIGFHHIHHLSPRIPNYHLQQCHEADPFFSTIKPVTLLASLKFLTFRLWDEQRNVFVGFR
jgi:acyl-lipid omega-6 desaturase (Delta-12 desaturase)